MPRFFIKLGEDKYILWSTVVDAPVTWTMSREEAIREGSEAAIARCDETGVWSCRQEPPTVEELLSCNRAGETVPGFIPTRVTDVLEVADVDGCSYWEETVHEIWIFFPGRHWIRAASRSRATP